MLIRLICFATSRSTHRCARDASVPSSSRQRNLTFSAAIPQRRDLRASEGTTNRVRLQESSFLALDVLLPPLREQQRLVALIEQLAAHIHEARTLRNQAVVESDALVISNHLQLAAGRTRRLGEIIKLDENAVPVEATRRILRLESGVLVKDYFPSQRSWVV